MNSYVKKLKAFLEEQSPDFGFTDIHSLLEMLYYYYTLQNPIDNGIIRCQFREVHDCLRKLSFDDNDKVFCVVANLCAEHEKAAFMEGIHVGVRLAAELELF